jgi:hypothetical protein
MAVGGKSLRRATREFEVKRRRQSRRVERNGRFLVFGADGKLYLRDYEILYCYDVKGSKN